MILLLAFTLIPLLAGLILQYVLLRLLKRRRWLCLLPLVVWAAVVLGVCLYRIHMWSSEESIVTQLLFLPGVPALFVLLGLFLGWRLWRRRWLPRVIWEKKKSEDSDVSASRPVGGGALPGRHRAV